MARAGNGLPTPEMVKHPTATSTGMRGFLEWMKADPVMNRVYARAKGQIAQLVSREAGAPVPLSGFGDVSSDPYASVDLTSAFAVAPDTSTISDALTSSAPTSSDSSGWASALSSIVSTVGQAVLTADQISTASKVTNLQLQRAATGQPPLNLSAYGVSTTPGVSVGLSSGTQSLLLWGGLGVLGVWLLTSVLKHR